MLQNTTKHVTSLLTLLLIGICNAHAQPASPRLANYDITATLDPESRTITATEMLTWKNHTNDTVPDLQFHLYLNAFKNEKSTFFKESGGQLRGIELESKDGENVWGFVEIESIKLLSLNQKDLNADLTNRLQFIQPDDNNKDDQTVAQVLLPSPVLPKGEVKLEIKFKSKLPKIFARTGYAADGKFFLVAQWFPKIGVYEGPGERYVPLTASKGRWNCHQFHGNSEFFADFGVYRVSITLSKSYVVGATGVLQSETQQGDLKTLVFYQEDVHDFAWTASPLFEVFEDAYQSKDGHTIKLTFLAQPQHADQAERHFTAVKHTLEWAEEWLGVYPYSTLTIVDPVYGGFGAGGMEYPTFITAGTFWKIPLGIKTTEIVTVHEFGHQYFYGMLASNEFEEAWLDEGMNTWLEISVMRRYYGGEAGKKSALGDKTSAVDFAGLRIGNTEQSRVGYTSPASVKRDTIVKPVWTYQRGGYGVFSYNKPGTMMTTLENILGEEMMKRVMRTYFERFKFKHPTTQDFIRTVNEVTSKDFTPFFNQFLYSTVALDYAVQAITVGESSDDESEGVSTDTKNKEGTFKSKVIFERKEEAIAPMEILIKFSDGTEFRDVWDGVARYKVYEFDKPEKAVAAYIDSENKYLLDVNRNNNALTTKPQTAGFWKWAMNAMFWLQNFLLIFA
ncbi:MAG: M1 family metallopeptidase [Chloroherpetonaceae bacterium]